MLAFIVLGIFNSCSKDFVGKHYLDNISLLNIEIIKISNEYGLPVLDTYSPFLKSGTEEINDSLYYSDGLHLLQPGYTFLLPLLLYQKRTFHLFSLDSFMVTPLNILRIHHYIKIIILI